MDNTSFNGSVAGFRLSWVPGGGWRVHLHTVPLWLIFILWLAVMAGIVWFNAETTYIDGEYHVKEAAFPIAVSCAVGSLPFLVFATYIGQVLTRRCELEYNPANETIFLPVLSHRKQHGAREVAAAGLVELKIADCAGIRVTPWRDEADALDPWDPEQSHLHRGLTQHTTPIQYRLEMHLLNGDAFPFAAYFPGSTVCWTNQPSLRALADWLNAKFELEPQPGYVPPKLTSDKEAWKRPLARWQQAISILAGIVTMMILLLAWTYFDLPLMAKHLHFVAVVVIGSFCIGWVVTDRWFRVARARQENGYVPSFGDSLFRS